MKSLNKVTLIGNLGKDPESRTFPDGGAVCNVSIATSESWKDKSGNQQERTEWHKLVFRDRGNYRLGEIAGKYLRKGSKIYIEGKLQTRQWQNKEGVTQYTTEIDVSDLMMLDGKQQDSTPAPAAQPQAQQPSFEDDIPF